MSASITSSGKVVDVGLAPGNNVNFTVRTMVELDYCYSHTAATAVGNC